MCEADSILLLTDLLHEKIETCRDELNLAEAMNLPLEYVRWKTELNNYKTLLEIALKR